MNPKEYVENAIKTESPAIDVLNRWNENKTKVHNLLKILQEFEILSRALDNYKKNTFYNKPVELKDYDANFQLSTRELTVDDVRLLHMTLGIITEAGELVQAIMKSLQDQQPLDKVNMSEEIGDNLWYLAIGCDTLAVDMVNIMERNIAKLKARFPNKFSDEKANNRDLETERKILEGKE